MIHGSCDAELPQGSVSGLACLNRICEGGGGSGSVLITLNQKGITDYSPIHKNNVIHYFESQRPSKF